MVSKEPNGPQNKISTATPLSTYGFGIGVATVYAQFLHGDLKIQGIDNYGTGKGN